MADLNKIRGSSQVQPGTIPASAVDSLFLSSNGDVFVDLEDHSAECDGRLVFYLNANPVPGSVHVFLRGLVRISGFSISGTAVTFFNDGNQPQAADDLAFSYRKQI